jgi:hypothetical protein
MNSRSDIISKSLSVFDRFAETFFISLQMGSSGFGSRAPLCMSIGLTLANLHLSVFIMFSLPNLALPCPALPNRATPSRT